jgi:tRNA G18 (ribose-2'-O)-methylase SpoU
MQIYLHAPSKLWNLALITRTLKLFGHHEIWVYDQYGMPLYEEFMTPTQVRRANKMSVGAYFQTKIHTVTDPIKFIEDCHFHGKRTLATVPNINASPLHKFEYRTNDVLILGAEAFGLPQEFQELCSTRVTIPSPGSSYSFNLGVAAGILLYEYGCQHQFSPPRH